MIIDFHTHFYPEKVVAKAMERVSSIPEINPATDGTRAGLLASMRRNGIDYSIGLPLVNTPANSRGVNRWAELNSEAPIFLLGSIHPADPEVLENLGLVAAAGFKGIKVHPEYQEFRFSDRTFDSVWRRCAELGLLVLTHAGADVGFPAPWHSNPRELAEFHRRFPELVLVLAHFGSWSMWDEVERELIGLPVYFDTAFLPGYLEPERMTDLIRRHGVERVLFGTDSPWCDQGEAIKYMQSAGLTPEEYAKIMGQNAASLLNLK